MLLFQVGVFYGKRYSLILDSLRNFSPTMALYLPLQSQFSHRDKGGEEVILERWPSRNQRGLTKEGGRSLRQGKRMTKAVARGWTERDSIERPPSYI